MDASLVSRKDPGADAGRGRAQELVGAWELKSYIEFQSGPGSATQSTTLQVQGLLLYTESLFVSAQISASSPQSPADGLLLSYGGRFNFDGRFVEHHVAVASHPAWIGTTLSRSVEWADDDTLVLRTVDPLDTGSGFMHVELIWSRSADNTPQHSLLKETP